MSTTDHSVQPDLTVVPGGLNVQYGASAPPVFLAAPPGAAVADAGSASLAGGGFVVTYLTADSHSLVANYAVFDRQGGLVAQGSVPGYSTAVEAIALPNGGFALADAQSDLFGLHASLSLEMFSHSGAPETQPVVVDNLSSPTGGAGFSDLIGQAGGGAINLSFEANGAAQQLTVSMHGPNGMLSPDPTAPGHPSASTWF